MNTAHLFPQLLFGLQQAITSKWKTGYTGFRSLQRFCNALTARHSVGMPLTQNGLIQLFNQPVSAWWPANWPIPAEYDLSFGILDGIRLSDEASYYFYNVLLENTDLPASGIGDIQLALDNELFRQIIASLRDRARSHPSDRAVIQREYELLRRFLIEQPITTSRAISDAFRTTWFVKPRQVGELYESASGQLSECERCGPLIEIDGHLRGIRQHVCNDHLTDQPHIRSHAEEFDRIQIRPGIHWRTCFPGKPEIELYKTLIALQQISQRIASVELWPGLDQYDLRIVFADGQIWALDVKDHRDPRRLGETLVAIDRSDGLHYNLGFYVIPDRWLIGDADLYLRTVRELAKLPATNQIIGQTQFIQLVRQRI